MPINVTPRGGGGGGLTEIDIKLDLEDQSPGFVNLTEIPTLNVVIADGGEPPAGLTVTYYYVEAGPIETLHFEFLGAVARYIWADFSDSPDCDTITSTGSWTGSALYVEAWQQAIFTQPAECWLDMQHCPLMTTIVFVGTDGHLTTRDCANVDTIDLDTLTGIHWWDTPDANLDTATVDAIIDLCVANGTNNRRLWLFGSASPTLSSPTAAEFDLNFQNLPIPDGSFFRLAGRTFGENLTIPSSGFDAGYEWSVNTGGSTDAVAVAAAYATVIEAHGFAVTDNGDGTLRVVCDTAGPFNFHSSAFNGCIDITLAVAGTGNADLTTLVSRNWDVGY